MKPWAKVKEVANNCNMDMVDDNETAPAVEPEFAA